MSNGWPRPFGFQLSSFVHGRGILPTGHAGTEAETTFVQPRSRLDLPGKEKALLSLRFYSIATLVHWSYDGSPQILEDVDCSLVG